MASLDRRRARRVTRSGAPRDKRGPIHRIVFGGLAALAVAFAATPTGASLYQATSPIAVSGDSPFAECTADHNPDNPVILGQESEPFVAVDPLNPDHIVGSWIQDGRISEGNGRGFGVGTSFDGGETWQTTVIPGSGLCTGGDFPYHSDPWVAFGPDGSLFHIGLPWSEGGADVAVAVNASNDGGLTWDDPVVLSRTGAPPDYGDDKESITVDPFDARYVYATWTFFFGLRPRAYGVVRFARSTDGGLTWEPALTTYTRELSSDGIVNNRIHVLPDGTLVNIGQTWRFNQAIQTDALFAQRSFDRGETWTPTDASAIVLPMAIGGGKYSPDDKLVLSPFMDTAVDPTSGALYVVWSAAGQRKLLFSESTDAGITWSTPISIGNTPAGNGVRSNVFLPTVAVAGDGTVGVTYYDWRLDGAEPETLTDVWFVHCHGASADCSDPSSWHGDTRVTETSFDLRQSSPGLSRYFLGHYVGLAASEHDFFPFFPMSHDDDPGSVFFSRIAPLESSCAGDCDNDGHVTVDEILSMVNIALGNSPVSVCTAGDTDNDGHITVDEVVAAVDRALNGCP